MQNRTPTQLAVPDFTPVPRKYRHDGWTAERQEAFLKALATCGCVTHAARSVGLSRESAYQLYNRPAAHAFRRGWDALLDCSLRVVEDEAWSRAVNGVARPIFFQGEQVGEYRHYDERLTMFLLRSYRPERYGKALDRLPASDGDEYEDEYARNDPGLALDGQLTGIGFLANDVPPDSEGDDDEPHAL